MSPSEEQALTFSTKLFLDYISRRFSCKIKKELFYFSSSMILIFSELFLLTFIISGLQYSNVSVESVRLASKQLSRRASFAMQYSSTELSNLKSITDKKLGSKLSQDYLLVSTILKPSQSRSEILDCIAQSELASGNGNRKLKVKIVKEQERFDRELKNYKVRRRLFVFIYSASES